VNRHRSAPCDGRWQPRPVSLLSPPDRRSGWVAASTADNANAEPFSWIATAHPSTQNCG